MKVTEETMASSLSGADQAAFSASSRSIQDRTWPVSVTLPSMAAT